LLRRNADLARTELHAATIVVADFLLLLGNIHRATVIKARDVRAGDAGIHAFDLHVALLFRVRKRLVDALLRSVKIDDLALAHAARRRLADAENLQRAHRFCLADHDANLRCADLESY